MLVKLLVGLINNITSNLSFKNRGLRQDTSIACPIERQTEFP